MGYLVGVNKTLNYHFADVGNMIKSKRIEFDAFKKFGVISKMS